MKKSPIFQARHYTEIAEVIHKSSSIDDIIKNIIALFVADNPNFNAEKFKRVVWSAK